jgi:hypothetical protein
MPELLDALLVLAVIAVYLVLARAVVKALQ